MKKLLQLKGWAVVQAGGKFTFDDVFVENAKAVSYRRNAFLPEHKAKKVRVTITISTRA